MRALKSELVLALESGERRHVGEVQTMKRKNITTAGDRVYVSFTKAVKVEVTKRGKKKKVKRGKSKKAVRRVPVLDPEAAAVLLRLRRNTHSELTPVWPAPQRSYQLARSTWERAMATVGLVHEEAVVAWKRALRSVKRRKAAAYTRATKASKAASRLAARPRPAKGIHGLRHLYGVTLTRIGTPVHLIRLWMGHSSLELTGRYTRAPEEEEEVKHLIEMYRQRIVIAPQTTPRQEVSKKPARTAGKRSRV